MQMLVLYKTIKLTPFEGGHQLQLDLNQQFNAIGLVGFNLILMSILQQIMCTFLHSPSPRGHCSTIALQ